MTTTAVLSFDVDAESAILAVGRRYADHAMAMTHQAFGPRVGVPRILALLAEYKLPATFFIPGLTAERYPQTVADVLEAGHEVAHHSWSHRSAVDLDAAGERADFERALTTLQALGVDVKGHRAAMWEATLAHAAASSPSTAWPTTRASWTPTPPTCWRPPAAPSPSCRPSGGWTTGSSTRSCRAPRSGRTSARRSAGRRALGPRARRDAPPRRHVHADLPPVPLRARRAQSRRCGSSSRPGWSAGMSSSATPPTSPPRRWPPTLHPVARSSPSPCRRPTSPSGEARRRRYRSAAPARARTAALTRSSAAALRCHCCQ